MLFVSIQDLEAAINYWRSQSPAIGEELQLCPEAAVLAKPYALMIVQGAQRIPMDVLDEVEKLAIQNFLKSTQGV
jgi:ABC-type hemin transport system substrate-binding protein